MDKPPLFPHSTPLEYSLFSPSKAAEQERLAKDWTYIHNFLRKKYPPPSKIPKFEENEETLNALLALAAANEKADEEWGVYCRVEEAALRELERMESKATASSLDATILDSLQSSLTPQGLSDLKTHSSASILLSTSPDPTALASSLLSLTTTLSSLQNQLVQLSHLQTTLTTQTHTLSSQLQHLHSEPWQAEKNLHQKTAETSRQTKLLKAKIGEYDERLRSSADAKIPEVLLREVEDMNENVRILMQRVREMEEKVAIYEGVPPDAREVRMMMEDLRRELSFWVRRRDELFEGLVAARH